MSLKPESKIRLLENFYALDYIFFGKPAKNVDVCCPVFTESYMNVKGALLSTMIEMYNLMGHAPDAIEVTNTKDIKSLAMESAKIARENCEKLVTTEKGKQDIKEAVMEALSENSEQDSETLVQKAIREKAFGLAVDNILMARAIRESSDYKELDGWEGSILEESYKMLRDQLIECALDVVENS